MRDLGFDLPKFVYVCSQWFARCLLEIPEVRLGNLGFYENRVLFEKCRYQLGEVVDLVFLEAREPLKGGPGEILGKEAAVAGFFFVVV